MDVAWAVKEGEESGMIFRFETLATSKNVGRSQNGGN